MTASLLTRTTHRRPGQAWPWLGRKRLPGQRRQGQWRERQVRHLHRGGPLWWTLGLLAALLFTAPAWLPWTDPDLNLLWEEAKGLDDAKHHMLRLFLLGWLVDHGVWHPRWVPDLFMGYGYPVFNYYAPGFYYVGLLLRGVLGLDVWNAYRAVGVMAAIVAAGGIYALVVSLWQRATLGIVAAITLLYGPYVIQTNLFQRGALPEALGLALLCWLPLSIWHLWRAPDGGRRTWWFVVLALVVAAQLLTHTLTALMGLATAIVWTAGLVLLQPRRGALRHVFLALLAGAGLSAFFWLPSVGESGAVQLEIGREGHLDYRSWLLDLGGNTEKQRSPENRQSRAGPVDLHLHYPHQHQFIVTLKPSLGQAVLGVIALAAVPLTRKRAAARRAALLGLPFLFLAVASWALLFSVSEPIWRLVPALSLMQYPGRLLGLLSTGVAVAGAGGLAALLAALEEGGRPRPRLRSGLAALAAGAVLFNSLGDREVPRFPDPKRPMDGRMIVQEEKDSFSHIGTTSGGEFTPRDVQIATYTAGQRRGRSVFERLYPERDWIGGLFHPLSGDVRFLGWRNRPLQLSLRLANDSPHPAQVGVRQFRFPGWRAWIDGRRVPIEVAPYNAEQQAALGFVVLSIPPGEHTVNLAFGPTPWHLAGMGLTLGAGALLAGVVAWPLARPLVSRSMGRSSAGPAATGPAAIRPSGAVASPTGPGRWAALSRLQVGAVLALVGVTGACAAMTYLTARGVRPAFGRFAGGAAPIAAPTAGVWRAAGLPSGAGGLVVNLAAAVRAGQARLSSPSGATLGPQQFIDVRQLTVVDGDADRGAAGASRREWLYLHPPSSVSVDVAVPAGRTTWFQAALAIDPATWGAPTGDGVRFQVSIAPLEPPGSSTIILDYTINPRSQPDDRRWVPVEADLSPWGGQAVRLALRTLPGDDVTFDWGGWGNPVVVVREFARDRPAEGMAYSARR